MSKNVLILLDYAFLVFHTAFTIFNVFGWCFKRTRKIHLITMLLTAVSWFAFGLCYGIGFCFLTEWHWQVRELLGHKDISHSYIHFLILEITGIYFPHTLVERITLIVFFSAFILSILFNVLDIRKKKAN